MAVLALGGLADGALVPSRSDAKPSAQCSLLY